MGAFKSSFLLQENEKMKNLKPSRSDWVFKHAEAMNMRFSNVQRCWRRFIAMGCNKKGQLTKQSQVWNSSNFILKQVLQNLSWSDNSILTFQAYLKVIKWFSELDDTSRLKVIFHVINNGNGLDSNFLHKFLKHLFHDKSEEEIFELAATFLLQADYKQQGFIDEDEFVKAASAIPKEDLLQLLKFEIIPSEVTTNF